MAPNTCSLGCFLQRPFSNHPKLALLTEQALPSSSTGVCNPEGSQAQPEGEKPRLCPHLLDGRPEGSQDGCGTPTVSLHPWHSGLQRHKRTGKRESKPHEPREHGAWLTAASKAPTRMAHQCPAFHRAPWAPLQFMKLTGQRQLFYHSKRK